MHIFFSVLIIYAVWRWADWKNWEKYQSTMLLAALGNVLYNFIYYNHELWIFKPEFPMNLKVASILFSFIILPGTALWFLSTTPKDFSKQIFHVLKWSFLYIAIEGILVYLHIGKHNYGWNMWWSTGWDIMMFSVWSLHYKKPLVAYSVSTIVIFLMLYLFPL